MPPRTRSALRDAASAINTPIRNPKNKTTKSRNGKKRGKDETIEPNTSTVLRDITDRYLAPPSPPATSSVISKAKTHRNPGSSIRTIMVPVESSLPPSSPPSTSSQIPNSYYYSEIEPISSEPIAPNEDADDPFGFFALEKKLKARRVPTVPKTFKDDTALPYDSPNISVQQAFATPKPSNPLVTPRRHGRAKKRRLSSAHSPSSVNGGESDTSNLPSTPSPIKVNNQIIDTEVAEGAGGATEAKEVKGKGRVAAKRGRKKAKVNELEMDPMEIARNLEALLPRWPKKHAQAPAKGRRSVKVAKAEEEETKQRKSKGLVRTKYVEGTEDSDGDEENEEKRARERQARIDYFKRLDEYEVQKEDVYVV